MIFKLGPWKQVLTQGFEFLWEIIPENRDKGRGTMWRGGPSAGRGKDHGVQLP